MKRQNRKTQRQAWLFNLIGMLLFAGAINAAHADTSVRASVDRNQLSMDETLTLTLLADSIMFTDEPDVSALENDFHILRKQQSSRSNIINGKLSSSRQWDYTLAPRHEGDITIPSIVMGKYKTRPLTVSVKAELRNYQRSSEQVFMESDVSPRSSYVQAQLDYTVKIFSSVNFLDASLEPLEVENSVVESLGEKRYNNLIDGRYYQVIERHYAIFPQTSGELDIPALTLQARVEGYRSSMLDPGRMVIKRSQSHRVRVSPPPKNYQGPVWLPARNLEIREDWSQALDNIHVGDSLTRSVSVVAKGLLGSQLPALPELQIAGAKLYPDQAKIDKQLDDDGLSGLRTESVAIIPTRAGRVDIPEIRLPWWNIATGKQEVAILPARQVTVLPAVGDTQTPPATTHSPAAMNPSDAAITAAGSAIVNTNHTHWGFWLALSLSGLLNIVLAAALLKTRAGKPAAQRPQQKAGDSEADRFKALTVAARQGNPEQFRQALLDWAAVRFTRISGLGELAQRIPTIADDCLKLDAALYKGGAPLTTAEMRALTDRLKRSRKGANDSGNKPESGLPPLYPTA